MILRETYSFSERCFTVHIYVLVRFSVMYLSPSSHLHKFWSLCLFATALLEFNLSLQVLDTVFIKTRIISIWWSTPLRTISSKLILLERYTCGCQRSIARKSNMYVLKMWEIKYFRFWVKKTNFLKFFVKKLSARLRIHNRTYSKCYNNFLLFVFFFWEHLSLLYASLQMLLYSKCSKKKNSYELFFFFLMTCVAKIVFFVWKIN